MKKRKTVALLVAALGPIPLVLAGPADLLCEPSGMAGVVFGQLIDEEQAIVNERVDSGVTYYLLQPTVDIGPFTELVVGVTPMSRRVFSIRLEMHGDASSLDIVIADTKQNLGSRHGSMSWTVVGNHHYAEALDGLDLAIYRIGDLVNGAQTNLLSYDCDRRSELTRVIEETRALGRGN